MNITEELFLLLLRDNGKDEPWGTHRDYGLRGAAVADLVVAGRIALSADKDPRLQVLDAAPTGDPVLDLALTAFAAKDGKRLSSLITLGKLTLQPAVAQELAQRGIITIGEPRMLGLVPSVYPTINPQPERATRARLASVLRGGSLPSNADLALLGILQGLDVAPKVLATEAAGMSKRDLTKRIEELAKDDPTGSAVRRSIQAMTVAMTTAVVLPVIVAGVS